jgi:lactate dehydrogenase-like 2-hydroxyacid dehydrogenase
MMKIGFFGKQNSFAREVLRRLKSENTVGEFLTWQSGDKAPSTKLDVIIAFGKVDSKEIEAQTELGLIQMASAGYEGVDVNAATRQVSGWARRRRRRRATASQWRKLRCS